MEVWAWYLMMVVLVFAGVFLETFGREHSHREHFSIGVRLVGSFLTGLIWPVWALSRLGRLYRS